MNESSVPDCALTIALPVELEEEMIDLLRSLPQYVDGFSILHGTGFGQMPLRTSIEQVRGRANRRFVQLILPRASARPLLDALAAALPSREVAWWTSEVTGMGRFA